MVLFDRVQAADAHANQDANVVGVILVDRQSRWRIACSAAPIAYWIKRSILRTSFFSIQSVAIEISNFAGETGREVAHVKAGNRPDTGAPGDQRFPVFLDPGP